MMETALTFDIEADEVEIFCQDVDEHLQAIESGILQLEQPGTHERPADVDILNSVFRAAHTLKAVAGAVGHQPMAKLTHTLETLFDAMREEALPPTQEVADELLATVDVLKALRDEVVNRQPSDVDVASILTRLQGLTEGSPIGADTHTTRDEGDEQSYADTGPLLTPEQATQAKACSEEGYTLLKIDVTASADAFAPAARLLQATMALAEAGQIIAQQPTKEDLLADQHDGYLWLVLATQSGVEAIEAILNDVSELARFQMQSWPLEAGGTGNGRDDDLGPPRTTPQILRQVETKRRIDLHMEDKDQTVRISVDRLDTLMDLVGEMVTDRTRLEQLRETLRVQYGKGANISILNETVAHVGQIIDQLQDEVMRARMLPISHLFAKFPRLVRDLARAAGKQIHLVIEGEATELDRSVIEAIGDPLIHLLRNAVDHGIEQPHVRTKAGKPATGTVQLTAEHAEGQIIITVEDDGQGIDPERIRRSAVTRGLLSEQDAARLSNNEAITLIFESGLSTATEVTGVSGRGVGLDVVRTNISRIGGSVAVESETGHGTAFRVTLPLTLAIVQTMLVALGKDTYAIPLTSIVESLYLSDVVIHGLKGNPAIQWRGGVLPLLDLCRFFDLGTMTNDTRPAIVVVAWGKLQAGLIVNSIIGKQEIVVKPLGSIIGNVPGLSGCTILGNGRIALIVDVSGLINAVLQARAQQTREAQKIGPNQ
jgi:two-component system chemotaxis sensor kinase CheA